MSILIAFDIIIGMAAINRLRGSGLVANEHIGRVVLRPAVILSPLVAGLALVHSFHILAGLAWALGWVIFSLPAKMRWASLGHQTEAYGEGRPLSWFEKFIDQISDGDGHVPALGLLVRDFVCILPTIALVWWAGGHGWACNIVPPVGLAGYWIGWNVGKFDPCVPGELFTGAAFGLAIALS